MPSRKTGPLWTVSMSMRRILRLQIKLLCLHIKWGWRVGLCAKPRLPTSLKSDPAAKSAAASSKTAPGGSKTLPGASFRPSQASPRSAPRPKNRPPASPASPRSRFSRPRGPFSDHRALPRSHRQRLKSDPTPTTRKARSSAIDVVPARNHTRSLSSGSRARHAGNARHHANDAASDYDGRSLHAEPRATRNRRPRSQNHSRMTSTCSAVDSQRRASTSRRQRARSRQRHRKRLRQPITSRRASRTQNHRPRSQNDPASLTRAPRSISDARRSISARATPPAHAAASRPLRARTAMKRPYFAGNGRAAAAPAPASGTFCADATPARPRVTPIACSARDETAGLAAMGAPLTPAFVARASRTPTRPPPSRVTTVARSRLAVARRLAPQRSRHAPARARRGGCRRGSPARRRPSRDRCHLRRR